MVDNGRECGDFTYFTFVFKLHAFSQRIGSPRPSWLYPCPQSSIVPVLCTLSLSLSVCLYHREELFRRNSQPNIFLLFIHYLIQFVKFMYIFSGFHFGKLSGKIFTQMRSEFYPHICGFLERNVKGPTCIQSSTFCNIGLGPK